jgi:formylglycine-generating enzyme required for sulfatase activity
MGTEPSRFHGDQLPVESVNWRQANDYCQRIGGRLPTEQEWEFAARAGSVDARYGSLDAIAWYSANSGGTTHAVGQKQANAFGLYDMLGNVWEWTSADYAPGTKAQRGGSWVDGDRFVRLSVRYRDRPEGFNFNLGFRCVSEFR